MAQMPDGVDWPLPDPQMREAARPGRGRPFSAYVHVPFCDVRCGYCDFNTYTAQFGPGADRTTFAASVNAEIAASRSALERWAAAPGPLRTVFFGGGTPTLLAATSLADILRNLAGTFGLESDAEVTVEANPDTVTPAALETLRDSGFTRVSVGVQSAVPSVLRVLDRTHQQDAVAASATWVKEAGLDLSFDLIYGAPGETLSDWQASLDFVAGLQPDHVSVYSLIVEEGTRLAAQIQRGELPLPDDDLSASKYELADAFLEDAGYQWYEISNYAKSASGEEGQAASDLRFASKHNLAYWGGSNWWGYGPGAHSHVGRARWWNVKHPLAYAQRLQTGVGPAFQGELLDDEADRLERLMLGIRTADGVREADFPGHADRLMQERLVEPVALAAGRLVLTLRGRLLADYVTRVLAGWE